MTCRYLTQADEAFTIDARTGKQSPATVHLCAWAEGNPARLVDTPRWVQRNMLSGHLLRYPEDCTNCPGFEKT